MSALAVRSLAVAVALGAAAALFAQTRDYGLLGFDTYPLIASARVAGPADLAHLASEPLMGGRYPSPMYRPLVSALFAAEYALFGLEPRGYQGVGAAAFACVLLALAAMGGALARRASEVSALRALPVLLPLCFALSPSYIEIVPVPARVGDLLCAAFCAAAVAAALHGRAWLAAAACAGAILSKETGFAAPVLVAAALALAPARPPASRLRAALESIPSFSVAAVLLGVRIAVLGGVGGHRADLSVVAAIARAPAMAFALARDVVLAPAAQGAAAWSLALGGGALALAAALVAARSRRAVRADGVRVAVFGGLWIAVLALTYASGGWIGAWYRMIPAVGASLVASGLACAALDVALARSRADEGSRAEEGSGGGVGSVAAEGSGVERDARPEAGVRAAGALRMAAALALAALAGALALQAQQSPLVRRYSEWERATDVAREFLGELDSRVRASADGRVVDAPPLPMWAAPRPGDDGVLGAAILSDYSVQAWADLAHGERRIRVGGIDGGVLPPVDGASGAPRPDELVVRLPRRRVGY